jgi:hypothetical protein
VGLKATITLDGPVSYSEPGRPSFVRGVPQITTDPAVIRWAQSVRWLKVEVEETKAATKKRATKKRATTKKKRSPKKKSRGH